MRRLLRALALLSIPAVVVGIFVFANANRSTGIPLNPLKVEAAWEYAQVCSGLAPKPGAELDKVQWIVYSANTRKDSTGTRILGEYLLPDTILIDSAYADTSWVISHELLHYLIHGDSTIEMGSAHPFVPFAFPCQLMSWQRMNGGIGLMGQHSR